MSVLERQGIETELPIKERHLILYDALHRREAYKKASELRACGKTAILICDEGHDDVNINKYAQKYGLNLITV